MKSILFEECKKHGINSFHDLQETDSWVNDATRKEINWILETQGDVFGISYDYDIIESDKLKGICNFGARLIFRESKRDKILPLLEEYKNRTGFDMDYMARFIKDLMDASMYVCIWK